MKILVIEDERPILESVVDFIIERGHVCEQASSLSEALMKIDLYQYDLIILDVGLPDGNGLKIIPVLKSAHPETGVLILSAKASMDDKITGLEFGADDYLTKPFHLAELNARIRAIDRRRNFKGRNQLEIGDFLIVQNEHKAFVKGLPLDLTRKEYDLMVFFTANLNRVLTKESIAEHLWGDHMDLSDSFDFVYTYIKNIRKKIQEKGGNDPIKTIYGLGYKFSIE